MGILKDFKFIFLSIIPLLLLTVISGNFFMELNKENNILKEHLSKMNPKKLEGLSSKEKDYEALYDRLSKKEFIQKDNIEVETYIIAYNIIEKSIISLDIEMEIIKDLYEKRVRLDDNNLELLKNYIQLSKSFNYDIVPAKIMQDVYEILGTASFQKQVSELYNKINKNIIALRKKNFTDINIKELSKLVEERNGKYTRTKILILSELKNRIEYKITKNENEILTLAIILGISILALVIVIVLRIKEEKEKVDIKEDIREIYNFFGKKVEVKTDKEAEELLTKIIDEIRELKEETTKAIEGSKTKSEFLANMSHEIRTPLNGIIGFTELLRGTELNEDQKEFIDIIEKSSESLLELINNILDISKIESDKIELENIPFNPIDEFENAVEVYGPRAAQKDINIGFFIDPALNQPVKGDPTKVKEVLINLMSNAVKFTPEKGEINVEIKKIPSMTEGKTTISFSVKDSGVGIPKEAQESIFEAFQQASSSVTREFGGTGLGLSISNKFIDLMGGKLELESEEGKGTKFSFVIEFDKEKETNRVLENKFKNYSLAVLDTLDIHKTQSKYLKDYLKYYGVKIETFKTIEDLERISKSGKSKLAIIDTELLTVPELIELKEKVASASITIKIDFISKAINKAKLDNLEIKYEKLIFEPLNNTKINNVILKNLKKYTPDEEQPEEEIEEIVIEEEKQEEAKTKILVAEDNKINQKLIKKTMEQFGFEIDLAENGLEALNKRKEGNYDIIFMDIDMPVMNGVEATHEILKWEEEYKQQHIPIIALTANAIKGDRERLMSEGLDEYTTKPLKKEEIVSILSRFLKEKF